MSLNQISDLNDSWQKTSEWLGMVADVLDVNKEKAYMFTRAVLHVLRDRLPVEEAHDLAAQLPLVLKGVFFDGYKPSGKPDKIKTIDEFIDRVQAQVGNEPRENVEAAADAVIGALQVSVSEGEIADVRGDMPKQLKDLFY